MARCLDVPAVHSGNATVFDRRPPGLSNEDFEKYARRQMAELRKACAENHGVVFDAYLRGLMKLGDQPKPRAQAYVDEFVTSLFLGDADGAVSHAARNFGTVYAGLRLAMGMGVLPPPWRPLSVRRAIKVCFRDGLKVSRLRDTTLDEARAILHQRLSDTPEPSAPPLWVRTLMSLPVLNFLPRYSKDTYQNSYECISNNFNAFDREINVRQKLKK